MTEHNEPTLKVICVACRRPTTFVCAISDPFADEVNMFECVPCGFSIAQSRTPLMKQRKVENRAAGAAAAGGGGHLRNRCSRQRGWGWSPKTRPFSWRSGFWLTAPVAQRSFSTRRGTLDPDRRSVGSRSERCPPFIAPASRAPDRVEAIAASEIRLRRLVIYARPVRPMSVMARTPRHATRRLLIKRLHREISVLLELRLAGAEGSRAARLPR